MITSYQLIDQRDELLDAIVLEVGKETLKTPEFKTFYKGVWKVIKRYNKAIKTMTKIEGKGTGFSDVFNEVYPNVLDIIRASI